MTKKKCCRCLRAVKLSTEFPGFLQPHKCFKHLSQSAKIRVMIERQIAAHMAKGNKKGDNEVVVLTLPPANPGDGQVAGEEAENPEFAVEKRVFYLGLLSRTVR